MTFGFFLCGEKGLRVLEAVTQIPDLEIAFVMAARDSALTEDHFAAIADICNSLDIEFHERIQLIHDMPCTHPPGCTSCNWCGMRNMPATDHSFAVGWRSMIRDRPNLIVLHDSLLPRYRGNCPVIQALIRGDRFLGVTAFRATDEMDAGPVLGYKVCEVAFPVKVAKALECVAIEAGNLASELCRKMLTAPVEELYPQRGATSYSLWRDEQDYRIDWKRSAEWIKRFIDAVGPPYKGAQTQCRRRDVREQPVATWLCTILDAEVVPNLEIEDRESHIGKVFRVQDGCPVIVCGDGLLKLTQVTDAPKSWYRQRLV